MNYKFTFSGVRILVLFSLFLITLPVIGQKTKPLNLRLFEDRQIIEKAFSDTTRLVNYVRNYNGKLRKEGYILSGIDSAIWFNDTTSIYLYKGEKYEWAILDEGNIPIDFFDRKDFKNFEAGKPVRPEQLEDFFESLINLSENNGYPFAQVSIKSPTLDNNSISGSILYIPGPLIYYDSMTVISDEDFVKKSYFEDLLNIKPGAPYNDVYVSSIENRLSKLDFLSLNRTPDPYFYKDKCQIGLDIKKRRINSFDLLIGFMPNSTRDGKLLITGLADISLKNLFRSGKELQLHWERLQIESQLLDIRYKHPFLLHSPISLQGGFNLLKQDSTFITRKFDVGAGYNIGLNTFIDLKGIFENSSVTQSNTPSDTLPGNELLYSDIRINYLGLNIDHDKVLARDLIPRSGWHLTFEGDVGSKKIEKDESIDDSFYDDINLNSIQFKGQISFKGYLPISENSNIYINGAAGLLYNENLFLNDLFRLGGINNLRGFNENEFYASDYLRYTLEYRYIFNNFSFIYAFFDQAFITNQTLNDYNDYPYGFGVGLKLLTNNNGRLNLAYAIGGRKNQSPEFSLSKIHIGYNVLF